MNAALTLSYLVFFCSVFSCQPPTRPQPRGPQRPLLVTRSIGETGLERVGRGGGRGWAAVWLGRSSDRSPRRCQTQLPRIATRPSPRSGGDGGGSRRWSSQLLLSLPPPKPREQTAPESALRGGAGVMPAPRRDLQPGSMCKLAGLHKLLRV